MVRRGSWVDDFVEAEGVTWTPQEIACRAAPRRCRPQKRRERRRQGGMMMVVVVVGNGRIVEASSAPAVVLVLMLLGHGERDLVADSLLYQQWRTARLLRRPLVSAPCRPAVIHEFGCDQTTLLVVSEAHLGTSLTHTPTKLVSRSGNIYLDNPVIF